MASSLTHSYGPALRLKKGEGDALGLLAPDLLQWLLPHFIIPPASEKDTELGRLLLPEEMPHFYGRRVGEYWPNRPCLLDPRFIFSKLGRDEAKIWLPGIVKSTISTSGIAILVASLQNLEGPECSGFRAALALGSRILALRITADDLGHPQAIARIRAALALIPINTTNCILVLDFSSTELSLHDIAADVLVASYIRLMEIGPWLRVIWQSTSYPDKNPALPGQMIEFARDEWSVWLKIVGANRDITKNLMFGDFGADCSKFNFKAGGRAAIPHFRYSTVDSWLISRGPEDVRIPQSIYQAASKIVNAHQFAGWHFSEGDRYLMGIIEGTDGPGSSTNWRTVNTVHHLTRVILDLAPMFGYTIPQRIAAPRAKQESLLDLMAEHEERPKS